MASETEVRHSNRSLGSMLAELQQDLDDAKRDREQLLWALPVSMAADARRNAALAVNDRHISRLEANLADALEQLPIHQPLAPDAPIPGVQHYSGCSDDHPRVGPDGICLGCRERACPECGKEACEGGCDD